MDAPEPAPRFDPPPRFARADPPPKFKPEPREPVRPVSPPTAPPSVVWRIGDTLYVLPAGQTPTYPPPAVPQWMPGGCPGGVCPPGFAPGRGR